VGPRAGLNGRKILSPPGFDPGLFSPQSIAIPTELPGPHTIIIIIIIIINCNWVVTRWQSVFYMYTKYEILFQKMEGLFPFIFFCVYPAPT